jgi:hypothetical protein
LYLLNFSFEKLKSAKAQVVEAIFETWNGVDIDLGFATQEPEEKKLSKTTDF